MLLKQGVQHFADPAAVKILLVVRQELVQIRGLHKLLPEIICIFHNYSAFTIFTKMGISYIIRPYTTKINMLAA